MPETFRKTRFADHVTSTSGYDIFLRRDRVLVRDPGGRVSEVEAEWLPRKGAHVHVFASTAPEMSETLRQEFFERIEKAFEAASWILLLQE